MHRHLSTVGIGSVFTCPPPYPLPTYSDVDVDVDGDGDDDGSDDDGSDPKRKDEDHHCNCTQEKQEILTWEMVGDIKSTPEDFIVREIGWAPYSSAADADAKANINNEEASNVNVKYTTQKYRRLPGWTRKVAGVDCEEVILLASAADELSSSTKQSALGEAKNLDDEKMKDHRGDDIVHNIIDGHKSKELSGKMKVDETMKDSMKPAAMAEKTRTPENTSQNNTIGIAPSTHQPMEQSAEAPKSEENKDNIIIEQDNIVKPMDGLRRILVRCCQEKQTDSDAAADDAILKQLSDLQSLALERIIIDQKQVIIPNNGSNEKEVDEDDLDASKRNTVWIPTAQLFDNSSFASNSQDDWKLLHQYTRQVFPLLQTESSSVRPSNNNATYIMSADNGSDIKDDNSKIIEIKNSWVCARIDCTYNCIAPYLSSPSNDLLQLYKFRNSGPVASTDRSGGSRQRSKYSKHRNKRGRDNNEYRNGGEDTTQETSKNPKGLVLLRLRPDLPRSERREIHQMLSSSRKRDFDTSTENDVSLDYTNPDAEKTTAIVVKWSQNAINTAQRRKRKRTEEEGGNNTIDRQSKKSQQPMRSNSNNITATFCVLRKEQIEHQVAVQNVVQALRCRQGDVGLAGIKDMQAITYQFCTIRNHVDLSKVQHANNSLGKRVHLSNFVEVQEFLLDRGKLLGSEYSTI